MDKLRYGIVGGGFVSAFHMRAICQVRGIEITGFVTRAPTEKLIAFANEHGLGQPRLYGSVSEMVPHVDVIALFGRNDRRLEVLEEVVQAIQAGSSLKGIICEKPLGRNVPEARRMVELVREAGIPNAYFENQLHMSSVTVELNQLVAVMEEMGPLTLVRSGEEHSGPHSAWFWDPIRSGGGVMNDMGCHCLAVGWYMLTPPGKPVRFLQPQSVQADLSLLKWGQPRWRKVLLDRHGVDYGKTPAEDFATGIVTYKNPETGQRSKAQFTSSWMYDMQGLRLILDGLGAGYALEMNSLKSPSQVFIGDEAVSSMADREGALEKSMASHGLLTLQPNEPDLLGYTDENLDAVTAFKAGSAPLLDWEYGLEIVRLTMAAYLSDERQKTIDLTDRSILEELENYIPLIQQGRGGEVL